MISLAVFHLLRTKVPTLPRQLLRCIEFHKIPQIIVISLFETFLLTWKLWCWKKWHLQNKILTKSFQNVSFLVCFIPQRIITHSMKNRRKIIKVHKVLCFLWGFFSDLFSTFLFSRSCLYLLTIFFLFFWYYRWFCHQSFGDFSFHIGEWSLKNHFDEGSTVTQIVVK